jgi:uncharacterized protein YjbI with pentapeptide repeats
MEWTCEQVSFLLQRWAFLEVLEYLGRLAVLVAVISYFTESGSRRKATHYQAWQVISAAQGKPGSGGRRDALQDLNRDRIPLVGVDISKAYLPELNLEDAELRDADLTRAKLKDAILSRADLTGANLAEAVLEDANLPGARLTRANLTRACLWKADLTDANLPEANLAGADLTNATLLRADFADANLSRAKLIDANLVEAVFIRADLVEADLTDANLPGAQLYLADFTGADLSGANLMNVRSWRDIKSIKHANVYGVKDAPEGFTDWALTEQGALNIENADRWRQIMQEIKWGNKTGDRKEVR